MTSASAFEGWRSADTPSVEQLEEYVELLRDTLRLTGGRPATRACFDEKEGRIIARFAGTERLALGEVTDWSIPDIEGKTEIMRYRNIVATKRSIGAGAARLVLAETDAFRQREMYHTQRTTYLFSWNALSGVYEARKNGIETISPSDVDVEVLPRNEFDAPDKLMLSVERTASPERYDFGWESVTEGDVDGLLHRTEQFQRDKIALLELRNK